MYESFPQTLQAGDPALDFDLPALQGGSISSLTFRQNGLLLLFLFKTCCPVCKYTAPLIQKLYAQYGVNSGGKFTVIGISQDDIELTETFAANNGGLSFPIVLDSDLDVSWRYGITHVPDLFLLGKEYLVLDAITGQFNAEGINNIARKAAEYTRTDFLQIVRPEDGSADIEPG